MARSRLAAGNAYQVYVRDYLLERGWVVRNFPLTSRPIFTAGGQLLMKNGRPVFAPLDQDVFGSDLIARKGARQIWIQASKDSRVQSRVDEFMKYFQELMPGEELQIWLKKNAGRWTVTGVRIEAWDQAGKPIPTTELLGVIENRKWLDAGRIPQAGAGGRYGEIVCPRKTKVKTKCPIDSPQAL